MMTVTMLMEKLMLTPRLKGGGTAAVAPTYNHHLHCLLLHCVTLILHSVALALTSLHSANLQSPHALPLAMFLKLVSLALRSLFTYCTVFHLHGGEPTITNCTVFQFHFASLAQCLTCKCFALAVISLHGVANLQSAVHAVHYCSLLFCFYKIFV